METLPLFIVLGCSLCLNLVIVIIAACLNSKVKSLEIENEAISLAENLVRNELKSKQNQLKLSQDRLTKALQTIEEMKTEKPIEVVETKVKATKKATKAEPVKKTTRRKTAKKEEK